MSNLLAIRYERGQLELLDQRLLPLESIFIPVHTPKDAFDAIRAMVVRGAPAIGCTAALAMAAWLVEQGAGSQFSSAAEASSEIHKQLDYLVERFLPPFHPPVLSRGLPAGALSMHYNIQHACKRDTFPEAL